MDHFRRSRHGWKGLGVEGAWGDGVGVGGEWEWGGRGGFGIARDVVEKRGGGRGGGEESSRGPK